MPRCESVTRLPNAKSAIGLRPRWRYQTPKPSLRPLQIKVKPNAKTSGLEELPDGTGWLAKLKSPPVGGKANAELIALIADHFDCGKAEVTIKVGAAGRMKLVQIPAG